MKNLRSFADQTCPSFNHFSIISIYSYREKKPLEDKISKSFFTSYIRLDFDFDLDLILKIKIKPNYVLVLKSKGPISIAKMPDTLIQLD